VLSLVTRPTVDFDTTGRWCRLIRCSDCGSSGAMTIHDSVVVNVWSSYSGGRDPLSLSLSLRER